MSKNDKNRKKEVPELNVTEYAVPNVSEFPANKVMDLPLALTQMQNQATDPLGMWTGVPEDPNEKPVQDQDDL